MKQRVRHDAEAGIKEYQTDQTSVRNKEREDTEAFDRAYAESLEAEWAEKRRTILSGINPDTGERYSEPEFREITDTLDLTQDELFDVGVVRMELLADELMMPDV